MFVRPVYQHMGHVSPMMKQNKLHTGGDKPILRSGIPWQVLLARWWSERWKHTKRKRWLVLLFWQNGQPKD